MAPNTNRDRLEVLDLDPLDGGAHAGNWQALCDAALDPNPFFGPAFLCPFLENMSAKDVRLIAVRDRNSGAWLAAAPVGRRRAGLFMPVRTAWASDYGPLGTPLVHPDADAAALECFLAAAAGSTGLLAIPYLTLGGPTAHRILEMASVRIAVTARSERASHDAGAAGEEQLAQAVSAKKRKEMRRQLRRLEDIGAVRFDSATGERVPAAFEAFLQLENSGWKGRQGTGLLSKPSTAAFSRAAVAAMAARETVRIDELRAGETLLASLVVFLDGGHAFTWKIAFHEDYARYSPGAQLALDAFRRNLETPGFMKADSLAIPGHSMIEPLWRGRLETGTLLAAFGTAADAKLKAAIADIALESRLRSAARAVKSRLGK